MNHNRHATDWLTPGIPEVSANYENHLECGKSFWQQNIAHLLFLVFAEAYTLWQIVTICSSIFMQ